MRPSIVLLALLTTAAWAQTEPEASTGHRVHVRVTGGLASLSLGQLGEFHQFVADAYVAAGIAVPTQRSFDPGLTLGADVLFPFKDGELGVGVRTAGSSAYSLYGDYAGTLDVVSDVRAVFVESVSVTEFTVKGPVRPFLGSRGGSVFVVASTEDIVELGEIGTGRSSVEGSGTGFTFEGFGGATIAAGPVDLLVQAGYRYARVARLTGRTSVDGETIAEGDLPYDVNLSGWTALVGLSLRR